MSEVVFFRFQPDAMDRETLERLFTGKKRKELLMRLTREIKTAVKNRTPRYYLIVGPRGVGKTHFVTLLYCNVKEQIENTLAVKLSEEEFSVYRVSDLLLRILELSEDSEMNLSDLKRMSDDEVVVAALDELKSKGKMIVLFLENLNQLLGEQMQEREVQRLRSVFQTENNFTVITTAPLVFPQVSEHEEPFFNFFEHIYLEELTRAELKNLVIEIATIENDQKFLNERDEYTQKIDAVFILTGGSPRMAMLLYDLMSKGNLRDVEAAFFKLLDENTPYYQDIFKALSGEKRKIFDTLIELGKPATPKAIAEKARLDNNTVNTLLRRLEKDGYVRSHRSGKTTQYEERERLFRLWRELRREPVAKRKLSILIKFLELWYSEEERKENFLERFKGLRETLDEKKEKEVYYWFLSLPWESKKELVPQIVRETYSIGKTALVSELVYGDRELMAEAMQAEFMILFESGKYEELLEKAEEAIREDITDAQAWFTKGFALGSLGRYEEASDAVTKSLELNPENAAAWYLKGRALASLGKYEEALDAASKSLELNPEDATTWYLKGWVLEDLGRYEEVLDAASKSLELNPEEADAWDLKARALGNLGRYEEALDAASKSLELNPEDATTWYLKGWVLEDLGRYEEALDAATKSLELNPEDADTWNLKARALGNLGRYEEALDAVTKSLELNPEDADAWDLKGRALGSLRRHEEALNAASKSLELNPENADAWELRGRISGDLERHKEALDAFSKSLELNPENADAWELKGVALENLGKHGEALDVLSKSLELNPENAEAWYVKGIAHLNMTTQEFGRNNYGNALESLKAAVVALDQFSSLLKDTEKAKDVIKGSLMEFLKELIETKNVKVVESALNALFAKKTEFKELFEPISIAIDIVKSRDLNKYYELQAERREVVVDIVKKLTGSDELVPEEYRSE